MKHNCSIALISCMDYRTIAELIRWMDDIEILRNCDLITYPGSSKSIADGEETLLKTLEVSIGLHGVETVILVHHSDCGAYKIDYHFENPSDEARKQIDDMEKSSQTIKQRFPGVHVRKVWAQLLDHCGGRIDFAQVL